MKDRYGEAPEDESSSSSEEEDDQAEVDLLRPDLKKQVFLTFTEEYQGYTYAGLLNKTMTDVKISG